QYMQEMLPVVQALWKGDVEHNGEFWQFPTSTSCPKPVQDNPPVWVAARSPITFDYALRNDCNVMSWPLTRPFSEAELYMQQFEETLAKYPNARRPRFAMMRHAAVYENQADRDAAIDAIRLVLGQFESLFRNIGGVTNGFPKQIPLEELANRDEYNADMLEENLLFGSPDEVIAKLKRYQALGVEEFIYYASMGLGMDAQKKSLKLFCDHVMPALAD
ncbi:MAG: LLM class flavin-dependent oxidoreductase, partial [Alphaproteobacteria bacterium]